MFPITVLDGFIDSPIFIILMLVAFFGVIALAVFLVRKYSKHFRSDEGPKTAREIADEEVDRILVDVEDEDAKREMEEAAGAEAGASSKPTPEEAAHEETVRATEEVSDPEVLAAMERYAEEHPEEAEAAQSAASDEEGR